MEKLTFIFKCIILIVAFPVIMFTELTRDEKDITGQKENTPAGIAIETSNAMLSGTSVFTQAIHPL